MQGKMHTNCICPSNLKERSKNWFRSIEEKGGLRSDARVNVEEDSQSFCCHFAKPGYTSQLVSLPN
jgi:hypothetical protein